MKTLREQFMVALANLGESEVKRTAKSIVFTRKAGGFYYLGRSGSLRYGSTKSGSFVAGNTFKSKLLNGEIK